jgi:hypothetical protein
MCRVQLITIFNMMQDVLCVLTRQSSQNSKLVPVEDHVWFEDRWMVLLV